MLDAATGERVGNVEVGEARRTGIAAHLDMLARGHRYVQIHTHPRSSSFSGQDAAILAAYSQIQVMVVIGLDGTWYALSKAARGRHADPLAVLTAWDEAVIKLRPRYDEVVRSDEMSRSEAWRAWTHEVWLGIAGELRLRYDRVEPIAG